MWSRNVQKLCAIDENRTLSLGRKGPQELEGIHGVRTREIWRADAVAKTKILNSRQTENLFHPKVSSDCFKRHDRNDKRLRSVRRGSSPLGASLPEGRHLPKDLLDSAEPEAPQRWHGRLRHTNKPGSLPRWSRIHGLDIRSRMIKRQSCQHHFWSPKAF